jgi:TatD DNase family protein
VLIDSHVNLHHHAFDADRAAVLAGARAAGVGRMVTICDRLDNLATIRAIAEAEPDIFASVGVHPHYAKDFPDLTAETLIALARSGKTVAIGETGLDQHYNHSPLGDQIRSFCAHIEAARATGLPLIVHTREADGLTGDLLTEMGGDGGLRILMHCYTSGMELARTAWGLGGYVSFSGIMTFKNATDVRAVAQAAPLDRVILETDCPYLAPVPHRGRRCEPAFVADVYSAFAQLRGIDVDALKRQVAENFFRLFSKVPR